MENIVRKRMTVCGVSALCALALAGGVCLAAPPAAAQAETQAETHDHSGWEELPSAGGEMGGGGTYYLTDDVELQSDLSVTGEVTLCLNGHILKGTGWDSVISVQDGADFTLCDCQSESTAAEHRHAYFIDYDGLYVFDDTLTAETADGFIAGGVVTGGNAWYGGGIEVFGDLTIAGGTVAGNYADDFGGGIDMSNGDLTITGGMIAGNYATDGGGIYFTDGTFEMTDGSIANNSANYGGGMEVWYSDVVIRGGSISGNTSEESGGGIYIEGSTFEMTDGSIVNNETDYFGGGVYFRKNTVKMTGGSVTDNSAEYGGGMFVWASNISISGGTVSDNEASRWGGGIYHAGDYYYDEEEDENVYTDNNYTLTVTGDALISGNDSLRNRGGGIYIEYAKMVMNGGTISGNEVLSGVGGGVYAIESSEITLAAGTISGNIAESDGGGIYSSDSTLNMSGGEVIGNKSGDTNGGGGIFVNSGSTLNLSGGRITDNFTLGKNGGGGIYAQSEKTVINLSGAPVVAGNMFNEQENNLFLRADSGAKANIVGPLTYGAKIGVTLYYYEDGVRGDTTGEFLSGYSAYNSADPSEYFFADNAKFTVGWGANDEVEVINGTYTVVYVDGGEENSVTYDIGAEMALESVEAEAGFVGGWTLTEGGTSIGYAGGQTFAEGLGQAPGDVITLYAVQARDLAGDVDGILSGLEQAAAALGSGDLAAGMASLTQKIGAAQEAIDALEGDRVTQDKMEAAVEAAQAALEEQIEAVQAELETAVGQLQASIASGEADAAALEEGLAALEEALRAAETLLGGDISALEEQLGALEEAYAAADDAVMDAVEALRADNAAMTTALWLVGAAAVVALAAGAAALVVALTARKRS